MIGRVHDIVAICIHPPAPTEITCVAGTKLGCSIIKLLEWTMKRQRVRYSISIIVQTLAGHIDHTCGTTTLRSACCGRRDHGQKRDEHYNEKHTYFSFHL